MRTRLLPLVAVLLALASMTACGGDGGSATKQEKPSDVLAQAKQKFDDARSVHLTLATDSTPTKGNAVLGADGTLTQQPAFEGSVKVLLSGFTADVPVTSVDGKVYAKLPLTPSYTQIDPAEYSAPDPADFADPDAGVSALLTQMQGVEKGAKSRKGSQILTTFTGTLPGKLVKPIIPSASAADTYATEVGIDDKGNIATIEVTGEFFSGGGDETYRLTFDDYGKSVTVTKP
ncbi:MAG TPA: LppX_LprAFG lipoprotein [Marmoricola sp.]|jgi:lipoprotein LprG|nr:LppX_LprAFG lipoprotein [Marmoricola sp.]